MDQEIEPTEQVSMAVVDAVSSLLGRDQTSLRPLATILDPDALDSLFAPRENGERRPGGEVSFVYSGCRVTIQNGEYMTVRRLDAAASPGRTESSGSRGVQPE